VTHWLLDTNVLSELRRPKPHLAVVQFIGRLPLEALYGSESIAQMSRRIELTEWLTNRVRPMFEERVLPVSEDVMFKWRLLVERGRKARITFSQPDLIIAATALHHGLTVISRDTRDYERAGVPVLNPWSR